LRWSNAKAAGMHAKRPAWAATHVGNVRLLNEDRYLVGNWRSGQTIENWQGLLPASHTWAVVADGMGGHEAGNVASQVVVDTIAGLVEASTTEAHIGAMLEAANRRLFEAMYQTSGRPGMGTTIVGIVLSDRKASVFNVGDSRAYALRRAALVQLTRDDTLDVRGGTLRNRNHALTQSLGGSTKPQSLRPHLQHIALEDKDILLLCSDGLTDMIDNDEIAGILTRHPENPAERLVAAALDAGGEDNITVVVIGPMLPSRAGLTL
jgi:serine/threonine protein phosphatase PrpC